MDSAHWVEYWWWNEAIFHYYFGSTNGRLVYLDVDDQTIDLIGANHPAGAARTQDFIAAVQRTFSRQLRSFLYYHLSELRRWKDSDSAAPPPFIAVLALFCLAAERMRNDLSFSQTNFYSRLVPLVIGREHQPWEKLGVEGGFRSHSPELWSALKTWLNVNDGQYGLPTAQPMHRSRQYVGMPMSQVLLRRGDRDRLGQFFKSTGLEVGQELTPRELIGPFGQWIPRSEMSGVARRFWSEPARRPGMLTIVARELMDWDGVVWRTDQEGKRIGRLEFALLGSFSTNPLSPGLELHVVLPIPDKIDGSLRLKSIGPQFLPGIAGPIADLTVTPGDVFGWSAPIENASASNLLRANVLMHSQERPRFAAVWRQKPVVVMLRQQGVFLSHNGLVLGRESLVLATADQADSVSRILSLCCRPGIARLDDSQPGVPDGWELFRHVIPEHRIDNDMFPELAITGGLEIEDWRGGISITKPREWSALGLPVFSAKVGERGSVSFRLLSPYSSSSGAGTNLELLFKGAEEGVEVDLGTLDLVDGRYEVVIAFGEETDQVRRQVFEVRSSDTPTGAIGNLIHLQTEAAWPLTAISGDDLNEALQTGYLVGAQGSLSQYDASVLPTNTGYERLGPDGQQPLDSFRTTTRACLNGGHEWFELPAQKTQQAELRARQCLSCGLCQVAHNLYWYVDAEDEKGVAWLTAATRRQQLALIGSRPAEEGGKPSSQEQSAPSEDVPPPEPSQWDLLLELCCTLRSGSSGQFENVVRKVLTDERVYPLEELQTLAALGHVDIQLDRYYARPIRWTAAPSVLATMQTGVAVLCGLRTRHLLESLWEACEIMGAHLVGSSALGAPIVYRIDGLDIAGLTKVAEEVGNRTEVKCAVMERPDLAIANALPPINSLVNSWADEGPVVSLERFDLTTGRFQECHHQVSHGLYRIPGPPVTHWLCSTLGWARVSYRIGKHLAARAAGVSLLWQSQQGELRCQLGAQLPGLYERAVVLASGLPPLQDGSEIVYSSVPDEVANLVLGAICPEV